MIRVGDKAPNFELKKSKGRGLSIKRFCGQMGSALFLSQGCYYGMHGGDL